MVAYIKKRSFIHHRPEVESELLRIKRNPSFRKATENMLYSYLIMKELTSEISPIVDSSQIGLILYTTHGELESTCQFLKFYAEKGLSRPIYFQNSLHHSTLGFIAQKFAILGPSYTIPVESNDQEPLERRSLDLFDHLDVSFLIAQYIDTKICSSLPLELGKDENDSFGHLIGSK